MRAVHRCLICKPEEPTKTAPFARKRGYTRHHDRVCSACRREGLRGWEDGALVIRVRIEPVSYLGRSGG